MTLPTRRVATVKGPRHVPAGVTTPAPPPEGHAAVMALLEKPRAARVLRLLASAEPMTQRAFTEASEHSPEQAKDLRDALERLGVLQVRALPGHGRAGVKEIRLTVAGREIADHLVAIEEIARRRLRWPEGP